MRQLDRGWIKHFSLCRLLLCITVAEIQGRTFSKWSKIRFFLTFWPTLWKPLVQPGWLNARMCAGLCPTYATALDDAEENKNGRRLSCCRRNPQNWYYVTQFLAHPVKLCERYTCDSWIGEGYSFFRTLLICLYFLIVSEILGVKCRNGEKNLNFF